MLMSSKIPHEKDIAFAIIDKPVIPFYNGERGGLVVEPRTPEQEVGLIPTYVVLCP